MHPIRRRWRVLHQPKARPTVEWTTERTGKGEHFIELAQAFVLFLAQFLPESDCSIRSGTSRTAETWSVEI